MKRSTYPHGSALTASRGTRHPAPDALCTRQPQARIPVPSDPDGSSAHAELRVSSALPDVPPGPISAVTDLSGTSMLMSNSACFSPYQNDRSLTPNFAFTPVVHDNDAWWDMKKRGYQRPLTGFKPIHMPSSTGTGIILAGFATAMGFGLIWYIWWLAAVSFVALLAVAIGHTFNYHRDFDIPANEVGEVEEVRTRLLTAGAKS